MLPSQDLQSVSKSNGERLFFYREGKVVGAYQKLCGTAVTSDHYLYHHEKPQPYSMPFHFREPVTGVSIVL